MKPLHELTAAEAASAIAGRQLTSEELVAACLARIREREETIGAWTFLDPEKALEEARSRDRNPVLGSLHGVPVGVKDIIDTFDMPTAYGSPIYAGHQPAWDASCVALVRGAGAVVLGKTVSTEFAMFTPGKTTNPHNPGHTPGGSSSGSAAAVAEAMVPLAFGSQTAGSVIRPASFCGVAGYKATHGEFSLGGIKPLAQSLDTLGGFARSVEDLVLLRAVLINGSSALSVPEHPPRVGVCRTPQWPHAEPATRNALETAASCLADTGASVEEVSLPPGFDGLVEAQTNILAFEGARSFRDELLRHSELLSAKFIEIFEPGLEMPYVTYAAAVALAEECRRLLDGVFADHDVLMVPSAPGEAPEGLQATGDPIFNRMWTLLHVPAVSLPVNTGPDGLPVGVQVIGPIGCDDQLLAMAAWMESRIV